MSLSVVFPQLPFLQPFANLFLFQWIDSLCIIQDSKADWQREAPLMAGVYRGSMLNIGAAASRSTDEGCFRDRDPNVVRPIIFTTSYAQSHLNAEYMIDHDKDLDMSQEEHIEPLFSRAWVFQERCLSPRMLNFGSAYIFWRCKVSRASEKHPDLKPGHDPMVSQMIPAVFSEESKYERTEIWRNILFYYSSLGLTVPSDKLVAISGISRELQALQPSDKYIAGVVCFPENCLLLYVSVCASQTSSLLK